MGLFNRKPASDQPTYVLTVTNPDGSSYDPPFNNGGGVAAYGDADRDRRVAAAEKAGKTAHVRRA